MRDSIVLGICGTWKVGLVELKNRSLIKWAFQKACSTGCPDLNCIFSQHSSCNKTIGQWFLTFLANYPFWCNWKPNYPKNCQKICLKIFQKIFQKIWLKIFQKIMSKNLSKNMAKNMSKNLSKNSVKSFKKSFKNYVKKSFKQIWQKIYLLILFRVCWN